MRLELGCGNHPTDGFVHHDKWKHDSFVDIAFDLEQIPWPIADSSVELLRAIDVFEHLRLDVQVWLDEAWRILSDDGELQMRLPAWDHHYSYRDPTHRRVFHHETFLFWCPRAAGSIWQDFGRYYFGENYCKWWDQISVTRDCNDLLFLLRKCVIS